MFPLGSCVRVRGVSCNLKLEHLSIVDGVWFLTLLIYIVRARARECRCGLLALHPLRHDCVSPPFALLLLMVWKEPQRGASLPRCAPTLVPALSKPNSPLHPVSLVSVRPCLSARFYRGGRNAPPPARRTFTSGCNTDRR